jgi:hypothetical protein
MKITILVCAVALLFAGVAPGQLQTTAGDDTPAVGSMAPDYGLDGLRGQTKVLLAFFPAAFTPG